MPEVAIPATHMNVRPGGRRAHKYPGEQQESMKVRAVPIDIGGARTSGTKGIPAGTDRRRGRGVRRSVPVPDLVVGLLADHLDHP